MALTALVPDNIGHLVALGVRDGGGSVVLLGRNGSLMATSAFCLSSRFFWGPTAIADQSGRVFVAFNEGSGNPKIIYVNRFEPLLSAMSRLSTMHWFENSTFGFQGMVPDETGGVFVSTRWNYFHQYPQSVLHHYRCDSFKGFFGQSSRPGLSGMIARAPNGNIYHVVQWGFPRGSQIQVIICAPDTTVLATNAFGLNEAPNAAACDSRNNLFILGSSGPYLSFPQHAVFLMKVSPQGGLLWRRDLPLEFLRGTLAVDSSDDVILVGDTSTLKLTSDGGQTWQVEAAGMLRVQRGGGIILGRNITDGEQRLIGLTKLAPEGFIAWRTNYQFAFGGAQDLRALVVENNDIYLAVHVEHFSEAGVLVVKIRDTDEHTDATEVLRPVIEAPRVESCEPIIPGPCDRLPPAPPPPNPIQSWTSRAFAAPAWSVAGPRIIRNTRCKPPSACGPNIPKEKSGLR